MEVLNLLNLVQWAAPASSAFGNSSFGQITNQANNMRMMQFTARFQFLMAVGSRLSANGRRLTAVG